MAANKKVARKGAGIPAKDASNPALAQETSFRARIRMYRQGVGDSFLLTFATPQGKASILIDCGVVTGTKDGVGWTERIATDVMEHTKNDSKLHAIVGTHPHWDHLSGFLTAESVFGQDPSREVWMAWTENPKDPDGRNAKSQQQSQLAALQLAMVKLASTPSLGTRAQAASINEILSFQGPDDALPGVGAAGKLTTGAAIDALRRLGTTSYHEPGEIIERSWLPGVRTYVLGPPRDRTLLGKMLSRKPGDMYELGSVAGFASALNAQSTPSSGTSDNTNNPFFSSYLFSPATAAVYKAVAPIERLYSAQDQQWRQIDDQWLLSAQSLALQLDNAINNLSMVLAFELMDTKQVLLFAADAQIGNWLSWGQLEFKISADGGREQTLKPNDLLNRTVFYKVGHHASHNATLKEGGLEAMRHPDLVAAIPVDEAFANNSKHWRMPATELYKRLLERTDGRVLRSDGIGKYALGESNKTFNENDNPSFARRVRVDSSTPPLWVECDIA